MKYSYILVLYISLSLLRSETGYPGLSIFSSSADLSLGGSGYLKGSLLSSKLNPSVDFSNYFATSLIRYPASITSENVGISFPFKSGSGSISIKHLSYGTFQGYDESAIKTSNYSAKDLSLKGSYSKLLNGTPLRTGFSIQFLHSSLNNNELYLLSFSYGAIFLMKKTNIKIGVSIHEIGSQYFKSKDIYISSKSVYSFSKKLKHLPLEILFDFSRSNKKRDRELFFGGIFNINKKLEINFGTSSRKLSQDIKQSLTTSIFGATGLGFSYQINTLTIGYGSFIYNNGITIHGLEIGIPL